MPETLLFYLLSAVAIGASALVIGQRNPMYSIMLLIASFGALSGLYIQLDAPFVAVAQIIVYAGAIMVLFLFVVMLLNLPHERAIVAGLPRGTMGRRIGVLLSIVLFVELAWAMRRIAGAAPPTEEAAARLQ